MKSVSNNTGFMLTRDLLREGREVRLRVQGQSMLPFFRSGQKVLLRPLREGDIARGHVVLGETDHGHYVIHRIIRVDPDGVTLFGDGNIRSTERIARDRIYGTVDCGRLHLMLARLWLWIRPLRKYPLWFLHRICRK